MIDSQSSRYQSSDEGNGSMVSSHSSGLKKTAKHLREYHVRKLKKLVDRCHKKKIKFPDNIVDLSSRFLNNSDLLMDDDLIELMAECNQSLASDDESLSSSDSSGDKPFKKIKCRGGGLLMPTPAQLDFLNPYNQA